MFVEKEIKILNINYAILIHQLDSLGAEKKPSRTVRDRYYDDDKTTLRHRKKVLRLRDDGGIITITQKTKISDPDTKQMIEQDMSVDTVERGHELLQDMGLHCTRYKEKLRTSYSIDGISFDIDCYKDIPPLLEIEGPSIEKILYRVRHLGLHYHVQVKWGSQKLFRHYS